jgi:UDP-glucuronate 4-epimerase
VIPPRTVLVTGGAGFIGSWLSEALLDRGDRVTVIDNFDHFYDPQRKRANISSFSGHPNFTLVEGDIRDPKALDAALEIAPHDAVVHLAARAGVRPSIADPALYDSVNVVGTTTLLEALRRHRVPQLVFGSSSSVYGSTTPVPFSEDRPADRPSSPYGYTKRANELACYAFHELYGTHVSCLRFFTVYGPRQRPEMAIHRFTRLIAEGREVPIFGDGSAQRDFTYVDDIVSGVLAALDHPDGYRIYNLGTTAVTRLSDLVDTIARTLDRPARISYQPPSPGDVPITYADITRARRELGYQPKTALKEGIRCFVDWLTTKQSPRIAAEVA